MKQDEFQGTWLQKKGSMVTIFGKRQTISSYSFTKQICILKIHKESFNIKISLCSLFSPTYLTHGTFYALVEYTNFLGFLGSASGKELACLMQET